MGRNLGLLALVLALSAPAAFPDASVVTYDVEMKGKSKSVDGVSYLFKAAGTMELDRDTGEITFDLEIPGGVKYIGSGTFAAGPKIGHGICEFQIVLGEPIPAGTAIFYGKFQKNSAKFSGKFSSVAPDMLNPDSLNLVSGKIKAVIAQ